MKLLLLLTLYLTGCATPQPKPPAEPWDYRTQTPPQNIQPSTPWENVRVIWYYLSR